MGFILDYGASDGGWALFLPGASVKNISGLGCIYGRRKVILDKILCGRIIETGSIL